MSDVTIAAYVAKKSGVKRRLLENQRLCAVLKTRLDETPEDASSREALHTIEREVKRRRLLLAHLHILDVNKPVADAVAIRWQIVVRRECMALKKQRAEIDKRLQEIAVDMKRFDRAWLGGDKSGVIHRALVEEEVEKEEEAV